MITKNKTLILAAVSAIGAAYAAFAVPSAPQNAKEFYVIPDDVKCRVRKKDKIAVCTDKNGTPITGEMRKFRENMLIRSYILKNGILDGTSMGFYISGGWLTEKPYKNGLLHGLVRTWYKDGTLETSIPYQNGNKEGVAKSYYKNGKLESQGIYINGQLNGATRLYNTNGEVTFEFSFVQDMAVSGTCTYYDEETGKQTKYQVAKEAIECFNQKQCTPNYSETNRYVQCQFTGPVPSPMDKSFYEMLKQKLKKIGQEINNENENIASHGGMISSTVEPIATSTPIK